MPQSVKTQLAPIFAALFSWRTGPFLWGVSIGSAFYLILVVMRVAGAYTGLPPLPYYAATLTGLACIGFAVQIATTPGAIQLNDEFMRSLVFKRISFAALWTILIVTIWSLLANMGWTPEFEAIYLLLLFLGVHTLLLAFINADRS